LIKNLIFFSVGASGGTSGEGFALIIAVWKPADFDASRCRRLCACAIGITELQIKRMCIGISICARNCNVSVQKGCSKPSLTDFGHFREKQDFS